MLHGLEFYLINKNKFANSVKRKIIIYISITYIVDYNTALNNVYDPQQKNNFH